MPFALRLVGLAAAGLFLCASDAALAQSAAPAPPPAAAVPVAAAAAVPAAASPPPAVPAPPVDPLSAAVADVAASTTVPPPPAENGPESVSRKGGRGGKKSAAPAGATGKDAAVPVKDINVPVVPPESAKDPDFKDALRHTFPLSPEQIRAFNQAQDQVDKAKADRRPPAPTTRSIQISMDPGRPAPKVILSDGYSTALTIFDATGQPWPILQAQIGEKTMFGQDLPEEPGNILLVWPKMPFAKSNLIILLEGAAQPIALSLETGRDVAYYSANLMVDRIGPHAAPVTVAPPPSPIADSTMRAILDGAGAVTPGVRQVQVSGAGRDAEGFMANGRFYLRTQMAVLSPAFISVIRSNPVAVYELPPSPVIEASDSTGRLVELIPSDATIVDGTLAGKQVYDPMQPYRSAQ